MRTSFNQKGPFSSLSIILIKVLVWPMCYLLVLTDHSVETRPLLVCFMVFGCVSWFSVCFMVFGVFGWCQQGVALFIGINDVVCASMCSMYNDSFHHFSSFFIIFHHFSSFLVFFIIFIIFAVPHHFPIDHINKLGILVWYFPQEPLGTLFWHVC